MILSRKTGFDGTSSPRLTLATAALFVSMAAAPVLAANPAPTLQTLIDRAQIEDLLVDYYRGGPDLDRGAFYAEDGILDVNGRIAEGRTAIEAMYKPAGQPANPNQEGAFRTLLTNVKIVVTGDSAVADAIWTGIRSDNVKATPRFVEQGREHDDLVKRAGRWVIKHRYVTSDGGLPPSFENTYKKR